MFFGPVSVFAPDPGRSAPDGAFGLLGDAIGDGLVHQLQARDFRTDTLGDELLSDAP